MKTIRTAFATILATACTLTAHAAEPIHIPADAATAGVQKACIIDQYPHGTFLKVVAEEHMMTHSGRSVPVTHVAEMYVARGLPVFLDDRQETMRLIETHCGDEMQPYLDIAKKPMKTRKTGYEKGQFSPD